jgi:hypothetical protein
MAYIRLGDMQRNNGSDYDAMEYYRLASIVAPTDSEIIEELKKRKVTITPSDATAEKKNGNQTEEDEIPSAGLHQHYSLYSLMMFLVIVFIALSVYHLFEFLKQDYNFDYLYKFFWDVIGVLVCYRMSYLAEDADKMHQRIINLEGQVRELEKYKDRIKLPK